MNTQSDQQTTLPPQRVASVQPATVARTASILRARLGRSLAGLALAVLAFNSSLIRSAHAGSFVTSSPMTTPRAHATATLLPSGELLVSGGYNTSSYYLLTAELFNPATGAWPATGSLNTPRGNHTATLLPNGKVLVVGGYNYVNGVLSSAELYDPLTGSWTTTGAMATARRYHTATLLPNGKVLVAGGQDVNFNSLASAELYDPAAGTWAAVGLLAEARAFHTATLLPNGRVLVAGGWSYASGVTLSSAELYDPATGIWTETGGLSAARSLHTATLLGNGKVLVAGGQGANVADFTSAELYDAGTGTWAATGLLNAARDGHTATLLPGGTVLVTGGQQHVAFGGEVLSSAEIYNPVTELWTPSGSLNSARYTATATLLHSGCVVVTGGFDAGGLALSSSEFYDPSAGSWSSTNPLGTPRDVHSATLLPNGQVLVAGGLGDGGVYLGSAELYDPASGQWTTTSSLNTPRYNHTATLLPDGKVLVAGGYNSGGYVASAELYDPAKRTWSKSGSMTTARFEHTATLLMNGKVLVAGGHGDRGYLASAEVFDPGKGSWSPAGLLATARDVHTATLLPNGKVLVVGGVGNATALDSSELYDPTSNTWKPTGSLDTPRFYHSATLLPSGKVLVAGGYTTTSGANTYTAELYDPGTEAWGPTGGLGTARNTHTAVLLTSGRVLVAGGLGSSGYLSSAELYEPATGAWTPTGSLAVARRFHTATLLLNGEVLAAGGQNGSYVSSAEVYDVGLGFAPSWQPQIGTFTSLLSVGATLTVGGSRFRGISEGSMGNTQDSPADYPLVQLRSLANEQTTFPPSMNWSVNSSISEPLRSFPPGYLLITVFVNGIPSTSSVGWFALSVPRLIIRPSGGGALLSWSANYASYTLETSPSLSPTTWSLAPGTPAIVNGEYVLSVSAATSSQYFCLAPYDAGSALSFDGMASYVSVGAEPTPPPWTAEFWANRQDTPSISATLLGDASSALKLEQFNSAHQVGFTQFGVTDYAFNYSAPANTWVHLAFVCDTTTRLYVNGALQDTKATTIPLPLGRIGYDSSGHPDYLKGNLDEIRVWSVARTQGQIQANMNHSLSVPQANLVGYWRFDEGNGTTAFDSSGQGKTGTLQNGPAWVISSAPLVP
jgi:N-acetylneuraminic acid mutarotase